MDKEERAENDWSLKMQAEIQKAKREEFDKTYAFKVFEKVVYGIVATFFVAFVTILVTFIVKFILK